MSVVVDKDRLNYVYSCDLEANIQVKIGTLEGKQTEPTHEQLIDDPLLKFSRSHDETCNDFYVTCQVFADGRPLTIPRSTAYRPFTTRWNWNEWITLPIKYCELPRRALLGLTIWNIYGSCEARPVGGTTVQLFGKQGTFKQGMHDLKVWPGVVSDGTQPTTTPGKTASRDDEMSRLAKLSKKHRNGRMVKVDWLDRLTFREIELINEKHKRSSNFMYLMIEFPRIHYDNTEFNVIYFEMGGDIGHTSMLYADLVVVPDPEINQENLIESKHHKLARSLQSGPTDRDLKPNAATRNLLNTIVAYPPTKTMTSEEKDLVWKFRYYLSSQKKALTKFLKSVNWSLGQEAKQALELLQRWIPMDVEDALELLSPAFSHPAVRKYAVTRLRQADDEDLVLYILQLVQALKYEDFNEIQAMYEEEKRNHQQVNPETQPILARMSVDVDGGDVTSEPQPNQSEDTPTEVVLPIEKTTINQEINLAHFLIQRSCNNYKLTNYLYWYLIVECDDLDASLQARDPRVSTMYITVLQWLSLALRGGPELSRQRAAIKGQRAFMERLVKLVKQVARESGSRKKKIEKLQSLLSDPEALRFSFTLFDPIPLPLDPEVKVQGIQADTASLFKSSLMPCQFTFQTTDGQEYVTIFKHGDDLRQDQLVLQIITLMDRLLRKENLDLKLTPYKVLATSTKHGFMQFIDSMPVADVLAKEGTLLNFFRRYAPAEGAPYGVAKETMDNYITSCAGYCVITYLLGVGDRHLDNLLLTTSGKLFHVDFGYILGRDPKPMPPPMKLSKEMVEAMGGTGSDHFAEFKELCYTAFLHLRRSANLILNLFSLMVDANVPDIALEPDKTVKKVQDRFRLDLTDEEAVHYMQNLIDVSLTATMAALMEQMHKFAQYWRR